MANVTNGVLENVNITATTAATTNGAKKRKPIAPMWRILGKARTVFEAQLSRSNEVKLKCIDKFMNAEVHDSDKFWIDYFEQVSMLLDSRRYLAECKQLSCDAANLAEHIVFLGSAAINKVLKNGVFNTLGNDTVLYNERLSPVEDRINGYREKVTAFLDSTEKADKSKVA